MPAWSRFATRSQPAPRPEKPIAIEFPDANRVDGSLVGGGRLLRADGADDGAVRDWLVFGATIRTDWPRSDDSGRHPTPTALTEGGFRDAGAECIAERLARHLMAKTDLWQEAGFAPIAKQYLSRLRSERGVCREIGDNGELRLRTPGKPVESKALIAALRRPSWLEPASGRLSPAAA